MEISIFLQAFMLTLLAGISTAIGAFLAFFKTKDESRILSFGLGFSGGVMVYLSFVEILPKSIDYFSKVNSNNSDTFGVVCFFIGMLIAFGIDFLIPNDVNPHELKSQNEVYCELDSRHKYISKNHSIHRTAIFTAIAITIHNFPEGFATFVSALDNFTFGLSIAIAVAIHNIPEGLAVSLPIYHATGNKSQALKLTFLSGLAEPLGAVVGYFILAPILGEYTLAIGFGVIAGIMVFISIDSLLPNSKLNTKGHESVIGVLFGMGIMAFSLLLLK
ncbi:zinc transporter ZupT [Helicobacter sp. MIT 14-3879]|uniref:zinc transporter ZupT n=1 Tax=Helicobacter sp. MIT 14-3879 TaxID=2040649 RepID=UPI000E1F6F8D|nr:zinc transporter ZupT [Helicobacter sp. MIT 14-3879]RDU60850.1 zinc transporter ZupT [Helicobacter sp. MIT 14-3879]